MAKTRAILRDQALYHLDLILWVQQQPWSDKFIPIVEDARAFRNELMLEKISGKD